LRPEALRILHGSDLIVHAGDVGSPEVLTGLREVAPTVAVRGNIDKEQWAALLPFRDVVAVGNCKLYVLHQLSDLDLDPGAAGFGAVISGHTHKPKIERRGGVLFLNSGSAGPRRFALPVAVAVLVVCDAELRAEIVELAL
jgi:putative phosphoesterase